MASNSPILLHCYTPGNREKDQERTWEALQAIAESDLDVTVVDAPTDGFTGYVDQVSRVWDYPGDMIILEQDLVPAVGDIRNLLDCSHSLCAFGYFLDPFSTGLPAPVIAHRKIDIKEGIVKWITENEHFSDYVGFGLTKIGLEARLKATVPPWDKLDYRSLDTFLSAHLRMFNDPWHIHYPCIEHNHK